MKKLILMLLVAASALTANAQRNTFYGNKLWDNWYIGINGGVATKTTHQALLKNLNPNVGLRLGKWLTPYFGVAFEGNAYFGNKVSGEQHTTGTFVHASQVGLDATFNLLNIIRQDFKDDPGPFEIFLLSGFSWAHNYKGNIYGTAFNHLDTKFAIDFNYDFGNDKQWQLYLEPAMYFVIAGINDDENFHKVRFDSNASYLQLNVGLNYKFLTSNGHHNFRHLECIDPSSVEPLNDEINNLRAQVQDDQVKIDDLKDELKKANEQIEELKSKPVEVVTQQEYEPNLPAVFYQCDKSIITPAQECNVAIAAQVLKKHPETKVAIKGYASPEGPHDNNTSLGIRRANAVKDMLIKKYGISPDRISAEGCGETDKLFEIYEFNRVAMLYLEK